MYIDLINVTKKFGDKTAVKNLSLSINKGELVSLLGPSGCGKTTTLKIIGGFIKPQNGKIIIDSVDLSNLSPNKRPVATVFQSYALFPNMNVINNVIYGLKFKKIKKQQAIVMGEEMLKIIGLSDCKYKNINELSGGQQQRVALARALILNPKLLLLDEPLSNLDAKLRIKMRQEIKEIQHKFNISMIFVTHDQEEALSISDKIAVINNGSIEQFGPPQEIYKSPVNEFVADFIGRINIICKDNKKIYIRPEEIDIHKDLGNIKGRIITKQYKGSITTYLVETEYSMLQVDSISEVNYNIGQNVCLKSNKI